MSAFEAILGPGLKETTAARCVKAQPDATLIMSRLVPNGPTAFRFIFDTVPGAAYAPGAANVTRISVGGYSTADCTPGVVVCSQGGPIAPVPLAPPVPLAGGDLDFDPAGHDGGALSAALAKCGCAMPGVLAVRVEVDVTPIPPLPAQFQGPAYLFVFCFPCGAPVAAAPFLKVTTQFTSTVTLSSERGTLAQSIVTTPETLR